MAHLSLSLLGTFQAWNAAGGLQSFRTVKERALLSYLVIENGIAHKRDTLAKMFWPDRSESVARNNLRQALYGIRQAVGEQEFDSIFTVTSDFIETHLSDRIWFDLAAFQVHIRASQVHNHEQTGPCPYCMEHLRNAVELCRGNLLEDVSLDKNPDFQDWVAFRREQVHRMQIWALEYLIQSYEQAGDFTQASMYAISQAHLDDMAESGYRRLITLLARSGRSGAAQEWYETLRSLLWTKKGLQPADETTQLVEQIRKGDFDPGTSGIYPVPQNLPEHLTPFIGREMELAHLSRLFESPGCRMISIIGLGGVGKTRLAVQAAKIHMRSFPDGVYFIPLEGVSSPEQIIDAIGQEIGLVPGTEQEMRTVLLGYMRLKHILLLLDNFEHLMEWKGLLLEILQAAPYVKILLTSRERLRLQAESLVELDGLSFPAEDQGLAEDETHLPLQAFDAVRLFLERASRVTSDKVWVGVLERQAAGEQMLSSFPLDPGDLEAAARICRLVNGIPLGIELAASLARDYSFTGIAEEVQHSLDFLESSFQDIPERQRSLRISFEHSWDLLPESEREVFTRLAVFPASFSAGAALAVAGAAMPWLMRLEDRSFVRRVAPGRYDLHPLIRQYAAQKLRLFSRRTEDQALQSHAAYFAAFMHNMESDCIGGDQAGALERIALEWENVQAAWEWAVAHQDVALVDQAAFSMFFFLESRTRWREGEARFRRAVEGLKGKANEPDAARVQAFLQACQGWFHCRMTNFSQAESLILGSLRSLNTDGMERERVFAHFVLGFLYTWMNRFQEAWLHLSTCKSMAERIDYSWGKAWAGQALAEITFESGQAGLSETPFLETLRLFETIGELRGCSRALNYLGNIAFGLGKYDQARVYFERQMAYSEKIGDVWGAAGGYYKLGQLAAASGEEQQAGRLYRRSLAMFQKMGDQRRSAYTMCALGEFALVSGDSGQAKDFFRQAFEIAARLHSQPLAREILTGFSAGLLHQADYESAIPLLRIVLSEPSSDPVTSHRANQLLESAQEHLPAEQELPARFANLDLWGVVDQFLREGLPLE